MEEWKSEVGVTPWTERRKKLEEILKNYTDSDDEPLYVAPILYSGNDLNMDQRNVIRDYSKWWPGAYQGHVDGDYIYLNVTTYNVLKPDASARHTTKMSMDNPDVRNALAQTIASILIMVIAHTIRNIFQLMK